MTAHVEGYYKNPQENFEHAYDLIINTQSHDELICMLKSGNIVQKQLAALKLDKVLNREEAFVLINNLTGQDGKVREAVSLKISELMQDKTLSELFQPEENLQTFLDAIIDINGNICRNIISALSNLKYNKKFCEIFTLKLLKRTLQLAEDIQKFDFQEGKYKVNKEVFKLYWYLETISQFAEFVQETQLKEILNITKSINEYTIREKTAKILTHKFEAEEFAKMRELLKNDTNYYVRRF